MYLPFPLKAGSEAEPVVNPETIAISEVKVCPVVIKLVVSVEMSPSLLEVICVCRVCPVVMRFPLMSSTIDPVDTKLELTA